MIGCDLHGFDWLLQENVATEEKEELDFMFDEELVESTGGRKNTFTEWSVELEICRQVALR